MYFEFCERETEWLDSIDIVDIGNCSLQAYNDDGQEFILLIETKYGYTTVYQFGGMLADSIEANSFSMIKYGFEYQDKKVEKCIKDFLRDKKKKITQVFEIEIEEAKNRYRELEIL